MQSTRLYFSHYNSLILHSAIKKMTAYLWNMDSAAGEIMGALLAGTIIKIAGLALVGHNHRKKFQQIGTVANLCIYPVKSCGAMLKDEADCFSVGLHSEGLTDRHWMILDELNQIICMDTEPCLTLITCQSVNENIRLSAPGVPSLDLPKKPDVKKGPVLFKKYYEQIIPVLYCGQDAEKWITELLKRPAKIVYSCPELGVRDVYTRLRRWDNTAKKGDVTIFAYLASYLIITTGSLHHINSQLSAPVSPVNFRPNIVVETSIPFDEDNWKEVRIGDYTLFHSVEPCRRCSITTIDPKTGEANKDKQPLALLKTFRCRPPYGSAPIFGLYVSNDVPGHIKVGDPVYVLKY